MMLCPVCGRTFDDDTRQCADCGETLVAAQEPTGAAARRPDDTWVAVCEVDDRESSFVVKSALDSSNIPSVMAPSSLDMHLPKGTFTGTDPRLWDTDGQLLMVPREFRSEALAIVRAIMEAEQE